jgi:hypothetical protein
MKAPGYRYLADPRTTRLTVERMWFEHQQDLDASAERFARLPCDQRGMSTGFLRGR